MEEGKNRTDAAEEEYRRSGWWHVNELLSYFERKKLTETREVWFENWESVQLLKRCIGKDKFLELLNEDSCNWRFEEKEDGTLVAVRVY